MVAVHVICACKGRIMCRVHGSMGVYARIRDYLHKRPSAPIVSVCASAGGDGRGVERGGGGATAPQRRAYARFI